MELNQIPFNQQPTEIYVKVSKQQIGASISPSLDLSIELRTIQKYRWIVQLENGLRVMLKEEVGDPIVKSFTVVDSRLFLNPTSSFSFAYEMLALVPMDEYELVRAIRHISSSGKKMANYVSKEGEGKKMCVDISIVDVHFFDEQAAMTQAMQVSMDEGMGSGVKPVSKSSIDGLQSVRFDGGDSIKDCTICLEELTVGSLVIGLPCNHVFHGNCITRWLETSHLCPLCRFEMPV